MDSDVLVVGGGVIGLGIARELHKRGAGRITLVEKGVCGEESSWAAGGMLGPQAEANEGGTFFDMCSASRNMYPALAAELLDETGIDIGLDRAGMLYLAFTDEDSLDLRGRYKWQRKAGLAVELWSAEEVRRAEPFVSPDVLEALFFPNDWQVDNRKLLLALRRYAELNGVNICENTHVETLIVDDNRVTGVETGRDIIHAGETVLATGAWTSLIRLGESEMPFKVEPVRGQIIAFHTAKRLFQRVIYSRRGYLVPRIDGRILAGSTSEKVGFQKAVTDAASADLREMANEIAPSTAGLAIADSWSGLRPHVFDGLPVIGRFDSIEALTIATAHYRNGILLAPMTAKIVSEEIINGTVSEYLTEFGPERFRLRGVVPVS
ncbi:glycine oxidase ThiO [soil metagenome]